MPKTKSINIAGVECFYKTATLSLMDETDTFVRESKIFEPVTDMLKVFRTNKELFAQYQEQWKKFCELVFSNASAVPGIEALNYPDDVVEANILFFGLPWEKTLEALDKLNENSASIKSQAESE